jgi:hypothetical protein
VISLPRFFLYIKDILCQQNHLVQQNQQPWA